MKYYTALIRIQDFFTNQLRCADPLSTPTIRFSACLADHLRDVHVWPIYMLPSSSCLLPLLLAAAAGGAGNVRSQLTT